MELGESRVQYIPGKEGSTNMISDFKLCLFAHQTESLGKMLMEAHRERKSPLDDGLEARIRFLQHQVRNIRRPAII